MRWRQVAVGLSIAILLIGLLVYGVGRDAVVSNVVRANPYALSLAVVSGIGILILRGILVHRLLSPIAGSARGISFVTAFLSGYFARSALPWGRSTGTAVTGYLLAANSDSELEENIAVVGTAEVFGFVGSVVVALSGMVLYVTLGGSSATLLPNAVLIGGAGLVAVGVLFVLATRNGIRGLALRSSNRIGSFGTIIGLSDLSESLTRRIDGFFDTLDTLEAARRTLIGAFGVAVASWLVNVIPLYLSLLALGIDAPFAVAMVCAPLASLGGILPVPGGTGGIEAVLAGLLVTAIGVTADVATATAILYRLSTYWVHLVIGGVAAVYLSITGTDPVRV